MAIVYGTLGLLAVFTGSRFGELNTSPVFNGGIALLFLALSLAMFDVYEIDFSRLQGKIDVKSGKGRYWTALFLGGVAALLAGACVAPVVISVLLLSAKLFNGGTWIGLLLPFILGLGMGLPWPFAGAGLSFLPRPGMWMKRINRAFGVMMILFAGYFAYLAYEQFTVRHAPDSAVQESTHEDAGWLTSLPEALEQARQEQKPIIIDFWTVGCKNCKYMDITTFKKPTVQNRLEAFIKVKFQADRTEDPFVKSVLDQFSVIGYPTYIVLTPNEK
jgi:thiol:disulfide interchange protein